MSELATNKIFDIFEEESLSFKDALLSLANVFVQLGMGGINVDPTSISSIEDIVDALASEKKTNGESIYTACVQQGLTIFVWLDSEKESAHG